MKNSYLTNPWALLLWATLGLMGCNGPTWLTWGPYINGRISSLAASPTNENTLFFASPGGGVYRTTDNGANWTMIGPKPDPVTMQIAWDQHNPGTLLAATQSRLWKCANPMDASPVWSEYATGIPATLQPLPANGQSFQVESPTGFTQFTTSSGTRLTFYFRPCQGIYYSVNGAAWVHLPLSTNPLAEDNCVTAMAVDPVNGYLYAASIKPSLQFQQKIARIGNWGPAGPGTAWQAIPNGFHDNAQVIFGLAYSPGMGKMVAAAIQNGQSHPYAFNDANNLWEPLTVPSGLSFSQRALMAIPNSQDLFIGSFSPYQSTDGGATWYDRDYQANIVSGGITYTEYNHVDITSFCEAAYTAPNRQYLWYGTDGYKKIPQPWASIVRWNYTPGFLLQNPVSIPVDKVNTWTTYTVWAGAGGPNNATRVMAGSLDNSSYLRENLTDWQQRGAPGGGDLWSIIQAPSDPDRLYARQFEVTVLKVCRNASTANTPNDIVWTNAPFSGELYNPTTITANMTSVHPTNPDKLIFAENFRVGFTDNAGATITHTPLHPFGPGIQPICVYHAGDSVIVGTKSGAIMAGTHNGSTWHPFGSFSPTPELVMDIAFSSEGGGTWYAATTRGLFRKTSSTNWTRINIGTAETRFSAVEVDPLCPLRIVAGTGNADRLGMHPGETFLSDDNGTTWTTLVGHGGMPVTQIHLSSAAALGTQCWIATFGGAVRNFTLPRRPCP